MAERRVPVTAPELLLKIVLTGTQSHYESRGLIDDKRLEHLLSAGKQILYKSHQESDVRQNLGFSPAIWQGLTTVLHRAIPVLEEQSFAWKTNAGNDFEGSSSDLIAANYLPLVKDIERLNDLCTIARNLLATTRRAQNLAAEKAFDQQILKLIDVCVRVTARGFDGETNVRNQDKWQKVVNLYKRLLITCLQFLHNFIMHNEHRKLVLWLDLFGNTSLAAQQAQQREIMAVQEQIDREQERRDRALAEVGAQEQEQEREVEVEEQEVEDQDADEHVEATELVEVEEQEGDLISEARLLKNLQDVGAGDLGYNIEDVHALFDLMSAERVLDPASQQRKKALMDKIKSDLERMSGYTATQLDDNPDVLLRAGAALRQRLALRDFSARNAARPPPLPKRASSVLSARNSQLNSLPDLATYANLATAEQEITADDLIMPRSSISAAETLQEAKDELMTRLHDNQQILDENGEQIYDESQEGDGVLDEGVIGSVEDSLDGEEEEEEGDEEDDEDEGEEDDEDDDGYQRAGDSERGLLTDVPLVLGPTEIEALPMIIQAGIVDNFGMKTNSIERQGARNMQAVRCHILLAQEAGRNVLRELLIFIAAWDLPDDEFYFKMMVQIMEAILKNGLMSHAYSDFGQAKDIISPAQAVVIKILTHIFRTKYSPSQNNQNGEERPSPKPRVPAPLSRVDVLTVRYIFTVFRSNIIPETCALIYLQGQIRSNLAIAEDFPLNLWDMERVYEGVYQFLEFFAVLTENNDWKRLLIEWEIVYDLVTLIKELDASIPKATLTSAMPTHGKAPPRDRQGFRTHASNAYAAQFAQSNTTTTSVERPYDQSSKSPSSTTAPEQDPSDFEWRNLKKLIVLVLSSLVWRSAIVQDQIRAHGGVPTILSCTQYDGHNPYIKEHAVMCLKFLLEGNRENQAIISELEARGVANGAELESEFGVRAGVNRAGRVVVENQQGQSRGGANGSAPTQRVYQQDQNYYAQHGGGSRVVSRPVRRASEGAATGSAADGGTATTAEKLANMTERFNRLDIGSFAAGLPIRQQQQLQLRERERERKREREAVGLPLSQSIREAYRDRGGDGGEEDDEVQGEQEEDEDEEGSVNGRVMDVGQML